MKLPTIILISITMIILPTCRPVTNPTDPLSISSPDIGVPLQREKYLEITVPDGWNSFKTGDPISLLINNISDKQIISKQDFGVRIYVFTDDKWIEVDNNTVYINDQITLNPNKNYDPTKIVSLFVLPDLPNHSTSSYIRIFIVGTVIENEKTTNEIASYVNLELHP